MNLLPESDTLAEISQGTALGGQRRIEGLVEQGLPLECVDESQAGLRQVRPSKVLRETSGRRDLEPDPAPAVERESAQQLPSHAVVGTLLLAFGRPDASWRHGPENRRGGKQLRAASGSCPRSGGSRVAGLPKVSRGATPWEGANPLL